MKEVVISSMMNSRNSMFFTWNKVSSLNVVYYLLHEKIAISYSTQISINNDAFYSSSSFKILMHCPLFVTLSWLIKCIDLIDHSQLYYSLIQGSKLSNRVIAHVYVTFDQQTSYHQLFLRRNISIEQNLLRLDYYLLTRITSH